MIALSLSGLALLVGFVAAWGAFSGSPGPDTSSAPPYDDTELREALADVAGVLEAVRADYVQWQADINTAVAEGIKHVERAENRIRATVRRAREELAEGGVRSPGLEAEALDIFGRDGGGSSSSSVPPMHNGVAGGQPGNRFAAFPGSFDGFGG